MDKRELTDRISELFSHFGIPAITTNMTDAVFKDRLGDLVKYLEGNPSLHGSRPNVADRDSRGLGSYKAAMGVYIGFDFKHPSSVSMTFLNAAADYIEHYQIVKDNLRTQLLSFLEERRKTLEG